MKSRYFDGPKPRVLAHRGDSKKHCENTLAAFSSAASHCTHFELDVWMSKDDQIIIHHDESLQRLFDRPTPVYELALPELKILRTPKGHPIATLDELCEEFPEHFFNIELKHEHPEAVRRLLATLERHQAGDRVLLAAEKDDIMSRIRRQKAPEIPTSMCHQDGFHFFSWLHAGQIEPYHPDAQAMQVPVEFGGLRLDQPEVIAAAHHLGLEVHFWTINEEPEMRRLLDLGADGLISDDPQLAAKVVTDDP